MRKTSKIFTFISGAIVALVLMVGAGFAFADTAVDTGANGIAPLQHRGPRGNSPLADYLNPDDMKQAVADVLGLTVAEVEAAKDAGTHLPELAEQQGVTVEEIHTAIKAVRDAAINAALADGAITQEQADTMLAQEGRPGGHRGQQGRHLLADYLNHDDMKQAVADVLGLTVAEVEAAKDAGTHLPELAEQQGVSMEEVHTAIKIVRDNAIDQALADGVITAEQAEAMKAQPARPGGRRPGGRPNGQGGQGGRPNNAPAQGDSGA